MYRIYTKKMLGDVQTPVSIYLKIRDLYPQSALLESSDYYGGENSFSFIAFCPLASFSVEGDTILKKYSQVNLEAVKIKDKNSVPDEFNSFLKCFKLQYMG